MFGFSLIKVLLPDEEERKKFRQFRRIWIPAIKTLLATAADVVGDWVFYLRTSNDGDDQVLLYESWLYFFCLVSSVLACFTLATTLMNTCRGCVEREHPFKSKLIYMMSFLLSLEILIEDIPQMWLTTMVLNAKNGGKWTPVGVFNFTTSAFNFTFSILDMLTPLDEQMITDLSEEKKKRKLTAIEYQKKKMAQQWTRVDDPRWTSVIPAENDNNRNNHNNDYNDDSHYNRCDDHLMGFNSPARNTDEADRIRLHKQWVQADAFTSQDAPPPESDYANFQS